MPSITATLPSTEMSAPMRRSSSTYLKRLSQMPSVTIPVSYTHLDVYKRQENDALKAKAEESQKELDALKSQLEELQKENEENKQAATNFEEKFNGVLENNKRLSTRTEELQREVASQKALNSKLVMKRDVLEANNKQLSAKLQERCV